SQPVGQGSDEADGREEVSGELVIACGDASEVFEAAEAALDDIATFIGLLVIANAFLAIGLAGDDRLDAVLFQEGAERVGIIAFVSEKLAYAGDQADTGFGHHAVGGIARREDQNPGTTQRVDNRVNLAVAAAF